MCTMCGFGYDPELDELVEAQGRADRAERALDYLVQASTKLYTSKALILCQFCAATSGNEHHSECAITIALAIKEGREITV